jgi:hypothetical protein
MMDHDTAWQDAALPADSQLIGPVQPAATGPAGDPGDYDELETGIASIFAALRAAGEGADDDTTHARDEDAAAFDDTHTFQLLGELDRLWQRPSP